MSDNGRISLLFVFNLIFYFLVGEANNSLSGLNISLHLDVLFVLFFGLYIGRTIGLFYTLLLGLLTSASHPVPLGTYLVGFLFLWMFLVWSQHRIRRQNPRHVRTVAAIAQAVLIVGLTLFLGRHAMGSAGFWQRVFFDLTFSLLAVYLLAWPWCRFQHRMLHSLGWNLDAHLAHR